MGEYKLLCLRAMKLHTVLFSCFVLITLTSGRYSTESEVVTEVAVALKNLTSGHEFLPETMSAKAQASLYSLSNINMIEQRPKEPVWPYYNIDCNGCTAAATLFIAMFKAGTPLWEIEVAVTSLCIILEIEVAEVCQGAVHNYGYQVEYIMQNMENPSPELFCGVFVGGDCGNQGNINGWEVEIPESPEKPPITYPESPDNTISELKVLQITDVHIDLSYLPGSPVSCGLPCCCMASTGLAGEDQIASGVWGDYSCDLPSYTFEDMVKHVAEAHTDLDYVIYTGDSPAHDVWLQTTDKTLEHQVFVLNTIDEYLPGIPVYLTLGNHEGFPVNSFPTSTEMGTIVSGDWLYGAVGELAWAANLEEDAQAMFKENGFYSTLVKPGFRIIGLNNNFCVGMNFFLFLDFSDPAGQLSWLVEQLLVSEELGEVVHILAHHPPGSCLTGWGREYTKIINRFQSTAKAQFHGHTHDDHYIVFHNETGSPSNTAFGYVMDHQTLTMVLSKVNSEEDIPE